MTIRWDLLNSNGPQGGFQNALAQGYTFGSQVRQDRETREAEAMRRELLGRVHANPDDREAIGQLFQLDPQLAMRVGEYQDERAFRSALGEYIGGQQNALAGFAMPTGAPAPQQNTNALMAMAPVRDGAGFQEAFAPLAQSSGGIVATPEQQAETARLEAMYPDAPTPTDAFQPLSPMPAQSPVTASQGAQAGSDLAVLGQPQNARDRAFLAMVQRDPMRALEIQSTLRDNFIERVRGEREFYTLAVEELSRVQDEAGWQAALRRVAPMAQALGADMSSIPSNYPGPEAVRALLENALPVKERLDYFVREANIEADNERADRNTDSMIDTRERRVNIYAGNVAADNARADRNTASLIANRGRRSGGRSRGRSTPRVSVRAGEPTATGANGETLVVRNGNWVEGATMSLPNPFAPLERAAKGDLDAQRELVEQGIQLGLAEGDAEARYLCFRDALIFARLAAVHGDVEDHGRLISLLCAQAETLGTDDCAELAEAVACLEQVADKFGGEAGEMAANGIAALSQEIPPKIMQAALRFRKLMNEKGCEDA